jgi:hypothetical protein
MSQNIFRSYVSCPNSTSSRPRTIKLRQPPTSSYDISCGMLRSPNISEIGGQAALIGSQIDANDPKAHYALPNGQGLGSELSPCIARHGHPNNVQSARPCHNCVGPFADRLKSQFGVAAGCRRIRGRDTDIDTVDEVLVK